MPVQTLISELYASADPIIAPPMQAYMRNLFPFLGIKKPLRNEIFTRWLKQNPIKTHAALWQQAATLWALPEREFHYVALELLVKYKKMLVASDLPQLERMVLENSWWDSVDIIAPKLIGSLLQKDTDLKKNVLRWLESGNIWLQRSAIIYQLHYKEQTDPLMLFDCIGELASSKEFFIQKAIGWALRQYARNNPLAVQQFVEQNQLAPLSKREALKHFPV